MIVVDTSALMSIFLGEDDAREFATAIYNAGNALVASPTAFEFLLVASKRKPGQGPDEARRLLHYPRVRVDTWTYDHAGIAHEAFLRFGKGRHPAALNYGDCMSYALAKSLDAPLLYKGDDFAQTDIVSALPATQ